MSSRALEIFFGVVTLVSVISVPVPRRTPPEQFKPRVQIDVRRVEELHRTSQSQREDVNRLMRDTRDLYQLVQAHDGGTVMATPHLNTPQPESETHECSH